MNLNGVVKLSGFVPDVEPAGMLSFDIAPTSTGWVYTIGTEVNRLGCIDFPEGCPGLDGLERVYNEIVGWSKEFIFKPHWIVIEDYSGQRGWKNIQIGEMGAVVKLAARHAFPDAIFVKVHPTRLPAFIGKKKVPKQERIQWLEEKTGAYLSSVPAFGKRAREDIADAMLMSIIGLCVRSYHKNKVELTPTLTKIFLGNQALVTQFFGG